MANSGWVRTNGKAYPWKRQNSNGNWEYLTDEEYNAYMGKKNELLDATKHRNSSRNVISESKKNEENVALANSSYRSDNDFMVGLRGDKEAAKRAGIAGNAGLAVRAAKDFIGNAFKAAKDGISKLIAKAGKLVRKAGDWISNIFSGPKSEPVYTTSGGRTVPSKYVHPAARKKSEQSK